MATDKDHPDEPVTGRAKGGVARAQALSPAERSAAAQKAASARWASTIPQALREGTLKIGDVDIECAVLPDGTRVLSERALTKGFGGKRGGAHWRRKKEGDEGADLPVFLSAKNISSNLPKDLVKALTQPILYRSAKGAGRSAHGVAAGLLPAICNALVALHRGKKLYPSQEAIALQAARLAAALADVGIVALVDEATGYQDIRPKDELRRLLEAYVSPEFLPWTKRFPDEFYKELFRLRGWTYDPMSVKRPKLVGLLTENIVYKRLPEGVLDELKRLNPKDDAGRRKRRHHQFLSDDIGNPHLEKHVASAITLMKISGTYAGFKKHMDKALPIPKSQLSLAFDEISDDEEEG